MKLIHDAISIEELKKTSENMVDALVKAVIGVDQTLHSFVFVSVFAQENDNNYDEIIAQNIAEEYEKENKNDIEDHINDLKERESYSTPFGLEEMKNFSGTYTEFFKGWMNNCQNIQANNTHWGVVYGCKAIVNLMRHGKILPEAIDKRQHQIIKNIEHNVETIKSTIKEKPFVQKQQYENDIAKKLAGYDRWDSLFGPSNHTKHAIRSYKNNMKRCSLSHNDPLNKNFWYCVGLADRVEEKYLSSVKNSVEKQYAQSFVGHIRDQEQKRVDQAKEMLNEHIFPDDQEMRASLAKKIKLQPGDDFGRRHIERSIQNCELNAPVYDDSVTIKPCYLVAQMMEKIMPSLTGKEKEYAELFIKHKKDGPYFDSEVQNKFPSKDEFGSSRRWFNMPN
jgi:hypothetical protein